MEKGVRCKTQEEWNFVCDILGSTWTSSNREGWFNNYKEDTYINIKDGSYGNINLSGKSYNLCSFEEWCKLTGNYPEWKISTTDDLSYLTEFLIKNEIT